jgi:hypothetical protein
VLAGLVVHLLEPRDPAYGDNLAGRDALLRVDAPPVPWALVGAVALRVSCRCRGSAAGGMFVIEDWPFPFEKLLAALKTKNLVA